MHLPCFNTHLQALTHSCCQETEPRATWTFHLTSDSHTHKIKVQVLVVDHSTMLLQIFLVGENPLKLLLAG